MEIGWGNSDFLGGVSPMVKHQEELERQPAPVNIPKEGGKELKRGGWEEMPKWK